MSTNDPADSEYAELVMQIKEIEDRSANNEAGDGDDFDEDDPQGSHPIDDLD